MTDLQTQVKELFSNKKIDVLLGWIVDNNSGIQPHLFRIQDDISRLVFNDQCLDNLVTHLPTVLKQHRKVGIVVKGCDGRSLITLLAEKQFERERIIVLAPACNGVAANSVKLGKCADCATHIAPNADYTYDDPDTVSSPEFKESQQIEDLPYYKRWKFFADHFDRCDRCYACRQVCPMCYCEICIVDQQDPQWIDPSTKLSANTMWHLIRAYHLAGRCADCGECERICPEHIPLRILNTSLEKAIIEMFKTRPGTIPDVLPVLVTFNKDTDEGIMKGA